MSDTLAYDWRPISPRLAARTALAEQRLNRAALDYRSPYADEPQSDYLRDLRCYGGLVCLTCAPLDRRQLDQHLLALWADRVEQVKTHFDMTSPYLCLVSTALVWRDIGFGATAGRRLAAQLGMSWRAVRDIFNLEIEGRMHRRASPRTIA